MLLSLTQDHLLIQVYLLDLLYLQGLDEQHELNQQNLQIATDNSDAVRNVANLFDAVASGPFSKGHPRAFDAKTSTTFNFYSGETLLLSVNASGGDR